MNAGAGPSVMKQPKMSRQPNRQPWMVTELANGEALALANSVDSSTQRTYRSALNSWLAFVELHHFPLEPTLKTLFYCLHVPSH